MEKQTWKEKDALQICPPGEQAQAVNQILHQSQEEEEHRRSSSLALTTLLDPSTPAPVASFQCHFPCVFSCRTSPPRKYQRWPGLLRRSLQPQQPGGQSQTATLCPRLWGRSRHSCRVRLDGCAPGRCRYRWRSAALRAGWWTHPLLKYLPTTLRGLWNVHAGEGMLSPGNKTPTRQILN